MIRELESYRGNNGTVKSRVARFYIYLHTKKPDSTYICIPKSQIFELEVGFGKAMEWKI
jgi:hypothetical protein